MEADGGPASSLRRGLGRKERQSPTATLGGDTAQLNRRKSRILEPPCQMAGGEGDLVGRGPSGQQLLTYKFGNISAFQQRSNYQRVCLNISPGF